MYDADKIFDIIKKSKNKASEEDVIGYIISVLLHDLDRTFYRDKKEWHAITLIPMPTDRKWVSLSCMCGMFRDFLASKPKDVWDKLGIKNFEIEEMYTEPYLRTMMVTYNITFK